MDSELHNLMWQCIYGVKLGSEKSVCERQPGAFRGCREHGFQCFQASHAFVLYLVSAQHLRLTFLTTKANHQRTAGASFLKAGKLGSSARVIVLSVVLSCIGYVR